MINDIDEKITPVMKKMCDSSYDVGKKMGALASYYSIAGSFGVFFSYSLGPYISTMAFNLVIAIIAAEYLVLFFLVGEECPHYFLKNQDTDAARKVLRRLRGRASKEITEIELQTIKAKIDADGKGNFLDIFRNRRLTKAFALVIAFLVFNQACGASLALFYTQTLFEEIGTSIPAEMSTIIIGGISFLSSFLAPHLVDRLGRKKTMYMSSSGILVSEIVLVVYLYLRDQGKDVSGLNFLPIAALAGVLCFYTCGLAFLPLILLGEIFPSKVKGPAAILALSFNFVMTFLVTKYVEFFFKSFGIAQTFLVCAGFTFFSLVFCRFCLIETSGRSLEEIQEIL